MPFVELARSRFTKRELPEPPTLSEHRVGVVSCPRPSKGTPTILFFGGDGLLGEAHRTPMNSKPLAVSLLSLHRFHRLNRYFSVAAPPLMAFPVAKTPTQIPTDSTYSDPAEEPDNLICSDQNQDETRQEQECSLYAPDMGPSCLDYPARCLTVVSRVERAWAYWTKLGRPKYLVAPMVDNSELPFRMLCRKYGAQAAYTPMLHSRIFTETEKYRKEEFSTCEEDRPLFVQFCANDPDTLLDAARRVEPYCDYVDINLGCPQRIARRGYYGAFLMDNLPLVKSLVEKLALNLQVPVSCKIRIFPNLEDTLKYARMLEEAGCSLLAVHGRTRDEKDGKKFRADWKAIKAVKNAVKIPVLANGNIRHLEDIRDCLEETGVEGVMSAETLLVNPALFAGFQTAEWGTGSEVTNVDGKLDQADLLVEYLKLCEKYPVPWRMIRSHVHKLLGDWFSVQPHIREDLNKQSRLTFEFLYDMIDRLRDTGTRIPLYLKDTETGLAVNGQTY